ncbi:hypothetical protein D9M71_609760 [compost metagenome]
MIPNGQSTSDLETIHGFSVSGAKLVRGLITFNTQCVKQADDVAIQLDFPAQFEKQISLGNVPFDLDARPAGYILGQRFTKLPQLDQGCIGVAGKYLFGSTCKLQEYRVVLCQKGEITAKSHDQSFDCNPMV